MSDEIRAAVERIRTQWNRTSKIVDERGDILFDYVTDLSIVADAYLAEHSHTPTPDGPPAAEPEPTDADRKTAYEWAMAHRDDYATQPALSPIVRAFLAGIAHGRARLRAMEAALRKIPLDSRSVARVLGTDSIDAVRAALGAGPGT